jgi:hypothetical protein
MSFIPSAMIIHQSAYRVSSADSRWGCGFLDQTDEHKSQRRKQLDQGCSKF